MIPENIHTLPWVAFWNSQEKWGGGVVGLDFRRQGGGEMQFVHVHVPYLPVYKSIPCISPPPILEPKNKFFVFLGENFLEKLILY